MQVNFGSDEPIERIAAGEINHLFQPDGLAFFTRRIAVIGKRGHVDHIVLFGDTEAALQLPGEAVMIDPQDFPSQVAYDAARLDKYAAQAREPYVAPTLTEYALPETEGAVDLASEANPPRFKIGDKVTPIKAGDGLLAGKVYTVDEVHFHSTTGEELTGVGGSDRRWSNTAFRLAPADPLADDALLEQMESDLYPDGLPAE